MNILTHFSGRSRDKSLFKVKVVPDFSSFPLRQIGHYLLFFPNLEAKSVKAKRTMLVVSPDILLTDRLIASDVFCMLTRITRHVRWSPNQVISVQLDFESHADDNKKAHQCLHFLFVCFNVWFGFKSVLTVFFCLLLEE